MNENNNNYSFGGGFLTLLTILFIGLKLGEVGVVATWSWWWVLSPMWIPLAIIAVLLLIVGIIVLISK